MKRESSLLCVLAGLVALLSACSSGGRATLAGGQPAQGMTTDFGVAYIKRTLPTDPVKFAALQGKDDLRHLRPFWSKADVFVRDLASPSGKERNVTSRITGTDYYDVRDLDVSADGTRLVFAMRGPLVETMKDYDAPTWRVWEYVVATDDLHPLTDDVTASGGQDVSPHYLPADATHPYGRVLLTSTRQRQSKGVLLQEGKAGFEAQTEDNDESAFTLEVLDPTLTGPSAFQQISFNQSHDRDPTVMSSGRILFTRWDHARGGPNGMHLYTMNPDGSDLQLLYGARSHASGSIDPATGLPSVVQFVHPRQLQDGRVAVITRPFDPGADFGGQLVIIDVANNVECNQRLPAATGSATGNPPCPAQAPATQNDVRTIAGPSPGGRFHSAFPLWDNSGRILVSWSVCRLQDATGAILPCSDANLASTTLLPAPPLYSIFMFNPADNTFKPVVTPVEGQMITDAVSLQAHTPPLFVQPVSAASTLAGDGLGILDIQSVYDWADAPWPIINAQPYAAANSASAFIATMSATAADSRPARFLRIEKAVSLGDKDLNDGFPDFDRNMALDNSVGTMREILGYVPIEADGSVRVKMPANVAFQVSVLDANGRRIQGFPQHRAWLQLRPGEVQTCNGCHTATTATSTTSHGRAHLFASANPATANGGRTMAQLLYGTVSNCGVTPCDGALISVNLVYAGSGAAGDTAINLGYNAPGGGLSTPLPTSLSCINSYSSICRITINYAARANQPPSPAIIHPLWKLARGPAGANTCVGCHSSAQTHVVQCTPSGGLVPISVTVHTTPGGGLDLDDDPAQQTTAQLRAYLQLLTTHTAPVFAFDTAACTETVTTTSNPAPIRAGSAAASRFFAVLSGTTTGTVNHSGFMTGAELRLLSEWVDIGAQYYNNPFAAPLN
jgi:hypothetical protein